jgi:glycosyltransferase involved in cell wall biosynthesis
LGLTLRGVFFKGRVEGEELAEAYRMADAFILTSRFENQPVVLLEALACGLPVISTNVGGISEVIHEGNGILIVPDDEQVITEALEQMVAKFDTFNREAIRNEAVERYSFEAVSKAYSEVYKQLPG